VTTLIAPEDERLSWHGVVSLERGDGWVRPWRLPADKPRLFPSELLQRAAMPSGARLAFRTTSTSVVGHIEPSPGMSRIDLCCDGEYLASAPLDGQEKFRFAGLPRREKLIELWLPMFGHFRLKALEIDDGATLAPYEDDRPRWTTYGSSITQCSGAASPIRTWPAITARGAGLNLTSLGFGGQCHLDPMVARVIRDLPADFISLCLGINIYGAASLSPRTFRPAIIGYVQTIRDRHPTAPIVLMSPIFSPPREDAPNAVGFTLKAMREEVAAAVEDLRACGDDNIHYVNGLDILGPEHAHLLPDELHPNAEGYELMGKNFLEKVARRFFTPQTQPATGDHP